jgi:hypothetical protein
MWLEPPTQSGSVLGDPDSKKEIYEAARILQASSQLPFQNLPQR